MARVFRVLSPEDDRWIDSLKGKFIDDTYYDELISGESVDVLKPDGSPLLIFRPNVLNPALCASVFPDLRKAARKTFNRGSAGGGGWTYRLKRDGTRSKTRSSRDGIDSGVIGHLDRDVRTDRRHPERFCRTTAYTEQDISRWLRIRPYIVAVNDVFRYYCRERYYNQLEMIKRTTPEFTIRGTAFTTVTVNRNVRTSVHKDKRDYKPGFGVMSVISRGDYSGCLLVFPKYRIAVDMRSTDVLLADVHEYHGNTELILNDPSAERLSTVMYYRAGMIKCGSVEDELQRRFRGRPERRNAWT